jgi:eukaryotic-like serine/threonine-protein kinase
MNRDRFVEIERVCQAALDRDSAGRAAFLDDACRGDAELRSEVEALLAGASESSWPAETARGVAGTLEAGEHLGPYEIVARVGAGGMGEVYQARDTRLGRTVAIKVLFAGMDADPERRQKLARESRAIAALNHPNICSLYDVGRELPTDGSGAPRPGDAIDFLVMEHIAGVPIAAPSSVETALGYAVQIADALRASHAQGIVHRDLKPSNVMVTAGGQVKVLDFGLAKQLVDRGPSGALRGADATLTGHGVAVGTLSYMSPEQVEGKPVDACTDIFSFGALFYELLTGHRAFEGDSPVSILSAILRDPPPPVHTVRRDVPRELAAILSRCLQKDREARFPSAAELSQALRRCQSRLYGNVGLRSFLRPRFLVPATLLLVGALAGGGWLAYRTSRARWARTVLLPDLVRVAAIPTGRSFLLAREARRYLADDPMLQDVWRMVATLPLIQTTPPGALVEWKDYAAGDEVAWERLGTTPLTVAVPSGYVRWRVSKDGYDTIEAAFSLFVGPKALELKRKGTTPPGMVHVPRVPEPDGQKTHLAEYYLDRYEVTNRQFKEFVDAGAYRIRKYWPTRFEDEGRELTWEQAMERFKDSTGRPGPSTWAYGTYPDGQAEFPVGGVSWFEAAAYAAFRGKSLPTVDHWRNAADFGLFSDIVPLSNFGSGPAPVGTFRGLGAWGTYDMAGNVKEWCQNSIEGGDARYILGGGFGEDRTLFEALDAQPPSRRQANFGIRCASYPTPARTDLQGPVTVRRRDYSKEKPVDDETFRTYRSVYTYDRTPLNPVVESVDETNEYWRKEKITFDAAYGTSERVIAYLFLPRNAAPPYQVVVYYPSGHAVRMRSSANLSAQPFQGLVRTGRAVLQPVFKGHFERKGGPALSVTGTPNLQRDRVIQQYRDLARSIDYLASRPDIDAARIAYYSASAGVTNGPVFLALEPRFKAAVLLAGGLPSSRFAPEIDAINFITRVTTPTLLLSGRYDFLFPVESSQEPFMRLLGAPDADKRHRVFENAGHLPSAADIPEAGGLIIDWLDKYLGPVRPRNGGR